MKSAVLLVAVVVGACSTVPNKAVCCVDPADCDSIGIDGDMRLCESDLVCLDNACVTPNCETQGCDPTTPVCNIVTDRCEGCTVSADCGAFPTESVCDSKTGACVQCVTSAECSGATPVCDANECRTCSIDKECASGACGESGACIAEPDIVYLDPGGADTGNCPRSSPCRTITYAVSKMAGTRSHLVMQFGTYVELATISSTNTAVPSVVIHGQFSTLLAPLAADQETLRLSVATTVKELKIFAGRAPVTAGAVDVNGGDSYVIERCVLDGGGRGLAVGGSKVTVRDTLIDGEGTYGILLLNTARLVADRLTIRGKWMNGIFSSNAGSTVEITNMLVYGTSDRALEIQNSNGTISFSTIAHAGTDAGTGPRAVLCSSSTTFRSSIIWAPGTTTRESIAGCNLASTIAGPSPVLGAMNTNPLFVDAAGGDFHLEANSPARDAVDTGPATDFEGDARPRGIRFDIGADEQ